MRLFIAVKLNEKMKKAVSQVQDSFRIRGIGGNYIHPENMHITLAFIGEYSDPEAVIEALEQVEFSPFDIKMDRIGCFDELWWTGFAESEELDKLARSVRRALAGAGIPYDKTKFKAHVTFLRRAKNMDKSRLDINFQQAGMHISRISLMRSDRGKNGMIYTELGSVNAG